MLFKDQAHALVARWESLRSENDVDTVAAQTAIALAGEERVPDEVMDALDRLLAFGGRKRATAISEVVRYLRSLAAQDPEKIKQRS